ncbi:MAG: GTP-binding protein HflX [Planctomycetota bacterium]|jgi:GTP-binding protein HflX
MSREPKKTGAARERFLVCGVLLPEHVVEFGGPLSEAKSLVEAAGAEVVEDEGEPLVQRRVRPDSSTFLGKGKVAEIAEALERTCADAVMVDNSLSPGQGRNLEKALNTRVVDRSELILDIFATRARTAQARLQVELAQMEYMRPRLRRMWTHLERMEGAVGTRGPGETQLETDRRLINDRIKDLKQRMLDIEQRKRRQVQTRGEQFTVGLIGYTNAGKSTLLNRLTGSDEFVADMPFATLDTRTRQWRLPDGRTVLLSDTVGFVQRLPHHLVASFHATLEEALNVDLVLNVADASHPDARAQMDAVDETLADITARRADVLVLNKVDQVEEPIRLQLLTGDFEGAVVHLSAKSGEGIDRLEAVVAARLDARSATVRASFALADGKSLAAVRKAGVVSSEEVDDAAERLTVILRVAEGAFGNLRRTVGDKVKFDVIKEPVEPFLREGSSA